MNCEEAQEIILDSFAASIPAEHHLAMHSHVAKCEACRRFAEIQGILDAGLAAAVPEVSLSPGFRSSLQKKLRPHYMPFWSESLPDVAHLIGCAFAIALLLLLLPQYSKSVILAGSGFVAATYFVQAALRSSLESLERNV